MIAGFTHLAFSSVDQSPYSIESERHPMNSEPPEEANAFWAQKSALEQVTMPTLVYLHFLYLYYTSREKSGHEILWRSCWGAQATMTAVSRGRATLGH